MSLEMQLATDRRLLVLPLLPHESRAMLIQLTADCEALFASIDARRGRRETCLAATFGLKNEPWNLKRSSIALRRGDEPGCGL